MAYKKLIKVSNVCQVLDKRTYPATGTRNGITFTHNGDGSYTANGTFTSSDGSYFYFITNEHKNTITLLANHKYLVLNGAYYEAGTYSVWMVVNNQLVAESNGTLAGNDFNAKCYTPTKNEESALSMRIVHKTNVDTVNFVFKPQLFDLTEMYGAGHEPTTVEQFRQDFPEEMYDYSPHCWLTSYKRVFMTGGGNYLTSYQRNLMCKTKNLFNAKAIKNTKIKVSIDGSVIIIPQGDSPNGYTDTNATLSELCPNLKVGDTAILNFETTSVYGHYIWLSTYYKRAWSSGEKKIITEDMLNSLVIMYGANIANGETGQVIITDIQLELGDTATDYVPYGHL